MPAKFYKVVSFFKTTLKEKMTDSQTTMKLNDVPGGVIEYPCWAEIEPNGLNKELIYLPSAPTGGDTYSSIVRGVDYEQDNDTNAGLGFGHIAGVDVVIAPVHRHHNELVKVMRGLDSTGSNLFLIGDGTDSNITIYAKNADTNAPFIRYDAAQNKWLFSNDGSSTYDPAAGGSGLVSGQGIQIIASAIAVRLKSSSGLRINQGAGSNEMDVDPTITARLDTANTWGAVQTFTAARLQITTDAASGNDAVRKSFLDAQFGSQAPFFGDGSDGALAISSGTTTLNTSGKTVYQYSSVSITGTAKLTTGANLTNKPVFILVQGNLTITSSTSPAVDVSGQGGPGGSGGSPVSVGNPGTAGATGWVSDNNGSGGPSPSSAGNGGGGGGGLGNAGSAGTLGSGAGPAAPGGASHRYNAAFPILRAIANAFLGGGGGGGSSGGTSGGGSALAGGNGGNGGGCIIFIVGGNINITSTFSAAGTNGANGTSGGAGTRGGGGGGGGGGGFIGIYYFGSVTANTATLTVSGGSAGSGGVGGDFSGVSGGAGGAGQSEVRKISAKTFPL